jgi:hypothetical protein
MDLCTANRMLVPEFASETWTLHTGKYIYHWSGEGNEIRCSSTAVRKQRIYLSVYTVRIVYVFSKTLTLIGFRRIPYFAKIFFLNYKHSIFMVKFGESQDMTNYAF